MNRFAAQSDETGFLKDQSTVSDGSAFEPEGPPESRLVVEEIEALEDARGRIQAGKLAGKSMWAAIWMLALPVFLQQTMQACVGLVDKIIAGRLPGEIVVPALDGIGIGSYVGWFIGIAMTGLGVGGQVLIARAMGSGNPALGHRALGQSMTLSAVWGALVGVLLWFAATPLAAMTQLSEEATLYCLQYVRTLACAMPLTGVMMVGAMCLHGAGETTKPSLIAVGVNVVNIIFSWALSGIDIPLGGGAVLRNPFPFNLHVIGIAAGTAISYCFGALVTIWVLKRGVKDLRLEARDLRVDASMIRRIILIGVPNFAEGIAMWMVNLFVLQFLGAIAQRGRSGAPIEGLQGAHVITVQWESLSFMPGFAIGTAAGALAGQYLGAGNPAMAKRTILTCAALAAVFMGLVGALFMMQGDVLTAIISDNPVHLEHVPKLLFICGLVQVFFALTIVARQGLRGTGDTRWVLGITTFSSYAIRLPAAYILGVTLGLGIEGIWMALCGELVIRAVLFTARLLHGGWAKVKV